MGPLQHFRRLLLGLFLAHYALVWIRLLLPLFDDARWPEGLLLILAAVNLLLSLGRYLPLQNVCLATAIILFVSGLVVSLGVRTGIPFGTMSYGDHFGTQLWGVLPWPAPVLWLVAVLSARGASRFLLGRWRDQPNYGFWLIGLGVLLTVVFDATLDPFATRVKGYWSWTPGHQGVVWFGAPALNFVGWAATALVILVLVTPALINKRPVPPPRDCQPLIIWVLAVALFITGALAHRFRGAAPVSGSRARLATEQKCVITTPVNVKLTDWAGNAGATDACQDVPTQEGYDRWAEFYDSEDNPLVLLEEQHIGRLIGDVAGLTVADVGCGTGRHALRLAAQGARLTAVDFSEGMLDQARRKPGAERVSFLLHDAHQPLPLSNGTFDLVLCCLVGEHIADLPRFFAELRRISRTGAPVVFSAMHPAMMLRGVHARFIDPVTGVRIGPQSHPHQVSDYVMAAVRAGLALDHLSEYAVDSNLAECSPRSRRYLGWPMLLLMRLRNSQQT